MVFLSALLTVSFLFWLFRPTTPSLRAFGALGAFLSAISLIFYLVDARSPAVAATVVASLYAIGYGVFAFRSASQLRRD